jgi:hypothetical protein
MPEEPECLEECFVRCHAGMMHVYVYADGKHYGYIVTTATVISKLWARAPCRMKNFR